MINKLHHKVTHTCNTCNNPECLWVHIKSRVPYKAVAFLQSLWETSPPCGEATVPLSETSPDGDLPVAKTTVSELAKYLGDVTTLWRSGSALDFARGRPVCGHAAEVRQVNLQAFF